MKHILESSSLILKEWLQEIGEPSFRADQILDWVFQKKASAWNAMANLPASLRQKLHESWKITALECIKEQEPVEDGTTKYLWKLSDNSLVESVLIKAPDRRTVCVSSQVGCPARCAFCASGKNGLLRNLTAGEIVEQVWQIDRLLKEKGERVCHVVFMGMGEPFENYENVLQAITTLSDPKGCGISQRKITVSTVGISEKIVRFANEGLKVSLVLSLHAPNQNLRKKLIPYARQYELADLIQAMQFFAKTTKRDITYEYTLLDGINDQPEHAYELADLVYGQPCTVNLIPYNPVEGLRLKRPSADAIDLFQDILEERGIANTRRYTKGKNINAACGQLALQTLPAL